MDFLTGFKYEEQYENRNNSKNYNKKNNQGGNDQRKVRDDGIIRDKEGIDFMMNFQSQQKSKVQVKCIDEHLGNQQYYWFCLDPFFELFLLCFDH